MPKTDRSILKLVKEDIASFLRIFGRSPAGGVEDDPYYPGNVQYNATLLAARGKLIHAVKSWDDTARFFCLKIHLPRRYTDKFPNQYDTGCPYPSEEEKILDQCRHQGRMLPVYLLDNLRTDSTYAAFKPMYTWQRNRLLLQVLANPPTREELREKLFLGTMACAVTDETRYFGTLWRAAVIIDTYLNTPQDALKRAALTLF